MRIEQRDTPSGIREKRFRFPCSVFDTCPKCAREVELDFSSIDYLTDPVFNAPQDIHFTCIAWDDDGEEILDCEHKWTRQILLRLKAELPQ